MIKRLKWNVLYGSDDSGPDDDSSGDSDDEYEKAAEALAQLTKNDPNLNPPVEDDGDDFVREVFSEEGDDAAEEEEDEEEERQEGEEPEFIEWRECDICPGKRFLNDNEVDSHLASKGHHRALKRFERAMKEKEAQADEEDAEPTLSKTERRKQQRRKRLQEISGGGADAASDEKADEKATVDGDERKQEKPRATEAESLANGKGADPAAAERKKQALKRKLKRMKERKWKAAQQRKSVEDGKPSTEDLAKAPPKNNTVIPNGKPETGDTKPRGSKETGVKRPHSGLVGGKKKRKKRALELQ